MQSPLPDWIVSIDTSRASQAGFTVEIDDSKIWEPGDEAEQLLQQISSSLTVTINSVEVPSDRVLMLVQLYRPVYVYDDAGNEIGSYSGRNSIYILQEFEPGLHFITLSLRSTSNRLYAYTWLINVP